jgi:uncharacterized metal-binding protein
MDTEAKTIECHQCKTNPCIGRYADGMPDYCHARKFPDVVESSKKQFLEPEIARLHLATAKVLKKGGYDWPRIRQCIEFARELGAKKVGLAVCAGLIREGREFARFLERAGFQVVSVICMVGAVEGEQTGLPEEWVSRMGISCNPAAQAEIMNNEKTDLNFVYGLCVGHDTIFIKLSSAPVTYVVAKDTVTGNNPGAIVFSTFHRMKLAEVYGRGK